MEEGQEAAQDAAVVVTSVDAASEAAASSVPAEAEQGPDGSVVVQHEGEEEEEEEDDPELQALKRKVKQMQEEAEGKFWWGVAPVCRASLLPFEAHELPLLGCMGLKGADRVSVKGRVMHLTLLPLPSALDKIQHQAEQSVPGAGRKHVPETAEAKSDKGS